MKTLLILTFITFFFTACNAPAEIQTPRSYELSMNHPEKIEPKAMVKFTYTIQDDSGETLKDFEVVHEKIMHLILVREDLQEFQHIHPDFNTGTGEFSVNITFPSDGPYRLFPDFTPAEEINPEKPPVTLSYDLEVGNPEFYSAQEVTPDEETSKSIGAYQIQYNFPKNLKTENLFDFTLTIQKNGEDVKNLEPYLGAMGHSVILRANTLDFIHTHAEDVENSGEMQHGSSNNTGPDIQFSSTLPDAGLYKIFTQFQHQKEVITTDYVVEVQ